MEKSLDDISRSIQGDVGVTIVDLQSEETLSLNGSNHFPMQSVFKSHIALGSATFRGPGQIIARSKIQGDERSLLQDLERTHALISGSKRSVTLKELITLTVMNSDNVARDMLLDILGGPDEVHEFIKTLGITDIAIVASEREMHHDWDVQFSNWTTPNGTAALLKLFYHDKILTAETRRCGVRKTIWQGAVSSHEHWVASGQLFSACLPYNCRRYIQNSGRR